MEERDRGDEQAADRETKTTEVLTAVEAASSWCCAAPCNPTTASCTLTVHRSSLTALYLLPRQKPENWTCHEPKLPTASTLGQRNAICCSEAWLKRACVACEREAATGRRPATSSHRFTSTPFKALKKCHQMAYFKSSSSHDHICIWRFSAVNYS